MRAVGILVDSTGKTIGVRINKNGTIRDIATDSLRGSNIKLDNAIVDCYMPIALSLSNVIASNLFITCNIFSGSVLPCNMGILRVLISSFRKNFKVDVLNISLYFSPNPSKKL